MTESSGKAVLAKMVEIADLLADTTDLYESELAEGQANFGLEGLFRRRFVQENSIMGSLSKLWLDLLRLLGVTHLSSAEPWFEELPSAVAALGPSLVSGWAELGELEGEWRALLERLDVGLSAHLASAPETLLPDHIRLRRGEKAVVFTDELQTRYTLGVLLRGGPSRACVAHVAELRRQAEALLAGKCRVVLVSRAKIAVGAWACGFPLLWDADGELADALHIPRCIASVASAERAREAAADLIRGETPEPWDSVYQCGADVLIRPNGRISWIHIAKESRDRCDIADIIAKVTGIRPKREEVTRL